MKHLFWLLLLVSGIASAQYQPSGSKVRYVNGIGLGTKSDAAFGTVDSLVLYAKADSTLMFKYKGTARALAYASALSGYVLYTDTSGMLSPYQRSYNAVTLTGAQTITGAKTFSAILTASSRLNVNGASDNASYGLNVTGIGNFSSQLNGTRVVMNNSSQTQGELWGWNSIQGASANAGEIRLGGTESIQGRLIFTSSGNTGVYIDNTFDDAAAEIRLRTRVAGTAVNTIIASANGVTLASLGTGTVYSNSGTLTNTNPSDSSLKDSIMPMRYGLAEILKLKPKTFYYKSDSAHTVKYGFIAQEVKPIMPDIVRKITPKDPKSKLGLETDGIYVTLVKAIQEQQAIIEDLKKRIIALENK